jgi:poly(A) polymerase
MAKLAAAGLRAMPTGLAHGTVTAIVGARRFEITTLRRDVETDGRHARVAFTDDWRIDAARRDFTINAMSAEPDGTVHDYFGGSADLRAGRVRFIGDADARLAEDHLRLLRFYRFHAHYGRGAADDGARAICRRWVARLSALSPERIRAEFLKLLAAPDPTPTVELMRADGVLAAVIDAPPDLARLDRLVQAETVRAVCDPLRRLGALALDRDRARADALADRLRLSNAERDRLAAMCAAPPAPGDRPGLRAAIYRDGQAAVRDRLLLVAADPSRAADLAELDAWAVPRFPVSGEDLLRRGVETGKALGRMLAELEAWWIAGDFSAGRDACLAELERRLAAAR